MVLIKNGKAQGSREGDAAIWFPLQSGLAKKKHSSPLMQVSVHGEGREEATQGSQVATLPPLCSPGSLELSLDALPVD